MAAEGAVLTQAVVVAAIEDCLTHVDIASKGTVIRNAVAKAIWPLLAADRARTFHEWNDRLTGGLASSLEPDHLIAMHDRVLTATVERETRERACKAMCPKCAAGDEPDWQEDPMPMWWHHAEMCKAAPIRALLPAEPARRAEGEGESG